MFAFAAPRPRRKPSLTPMIDVVFLLLVFFMLAARFGAENTLQLQTSGTGGSAYSGPPRLVDVLPGGLRLNGAVITMDALLADLPALMQSNGDTVVLRPMEGANLQDLVDAMAPLSAAGLTGLVLVGE